MSLVVIGTILGGVAAVGTAFGVGHYFGPQRTKIDVENFSAIIGVERSWAENQTKRLEWAANQIEVLADRVAECERRSEEQDEINEALRKQIRGLGGRPDQ